MNRDERQKYQVSQIVDAATRFEPEDLRNFLAALKEGVPYVWGSPAPLLGPRFQQQPSSRIYIPEGYSPANLEHHVTVYLMLNEYFAFPADLMGEDAKIAHRFMAQFIGFSIPRFYLLGGLAILNHLTYHPHKLDEFRAFFEANLAEDVRERFVAAMEHANADRALLYRQAILNTMRLVLLSEDSPFLSDGTPTADRVLMMAAAKSHAIAGMLGPEPDPDEHLVIGLSESVFMELICSDLFNRPRHPLAHVRRYYRLWTEYGRKIKRNPARQRPTALFREAAGLEVDEAIGLGLMQSLLLARWKPDEGFWYPTDFAFSQLPEAKKRAFVDLVSSPIEGLAEQVAEPRALWDFLAFEQHPIVRDQENRLLVLDEGLMLDRVLSGLYWIVHDHEKAHYGETERLRWTQAYGEMIELMAEDQIRITAPLVAGFGKDTTYYTEDEIGQTYGMKACDAAVYYGEGFCLFEIVSGRVSTGARSNASFPDFERDTDRLVLGKVEQLDVTAHAILQDERALTGHRPTPGLTIYPIVVIGGSYPLNPVSDLYLEERLKDHLLLKHPRIKRLAIIDLDELEMLEGLAEQGATPLSLVDGWKSSDFRRFPLRNYLIHRFGSDHNFEPKRVETELHETLVDLTEALR